MKKSEFYNIADIWYQRSFKLKLIWNNDTELPERRLKAYKLWLRLYSRVRNCVNIAIELNQVKCKS
jgi:hypothetical protein